MQRALCVNLPTWSVDLIKRRHRLRGLNGEAPEALKPVLLVAAQHNVERVVCCCPQAEAHGVRAGMTLAHARALLERDGCMVLPHDPHRAHHAMHRLAVWATRYSPLVAVDPPNGLLLDITGCQRVFGGEDQLARRVVRDISRLGCGVRVAVASTFGAAWAAAHYSGRALTIVPDGHERSTLADLPVAALRVSDDVVFALQELEIVNIAQVLELPRAHLAARFAPELLLRLDQALGQAMETIDPVRPQDPLHVERVFDGPVLQSQAIELTVHALLDELAVHLLKQERGLQRLEVQLARIEAEPVRLTLTLSHPTRSTRHVWSLLRPRVEQVNLGFGIEAVRLVAARAAALPHDQAEHWPPPNQQQREADRLAGEVIDTLVNRLGRDHVLTIHAAESHMPECACVLQPAVGEAPRRPSRAAILQQDRPPLLFEQPSLIRMELVDGLPARLGWNGREHDLIACIGPERVSGQWWQHDRPLVRSTRDYYRVQDSSGRWLWIYLEHPSQRWLVHGAWT